LRYRKFSALHPHDREGVAFGENAAIDEVVKGGIYRAALERVDPVFDLDFAAVQFAALSVQYDLDHVVLSSVLFNEAHRAWIWMAVKLSDKESAVERELVARVLALGGRCDKVQVIGQRGFFDRLIVLPGRIIFAELKRPRGGRMTEHQKRYRDEYRRLGVAVALVKTSADIDALLKM